MARLVQPWSTQVPLMDGQGNWGAITGDAPAAMRYTEVRVSSEADWLMLDGISDGAVPMLPTYDESGEEPVLMPVKLPMLLLNGVPSGSIGTGFASSIPPHNPAELCSAIQLAVEALTEGRELTVEEVMRVMPGPDFPTGGLCGGPAEIAAAYRTGGGGIRVRASAEVDDDRNRIVITAIPYTSTTAGLLASINEAALGKREGRGKPRGEASVPEVRDARDETAIDKATQAVRVRIVIEVKQGENPHVVLEKLYKHTPLQSVFSFNMTALGTDCIPRVFTLVEAIDAWLTFRRDTVRRAAAGRLEKLRTRQHAIEGLLVALEKDKMDAVVAAVRASKNDEETTAALVALLGITTKQAEAVARMELRRLNGLRTAELTDELARLKGGAEACLLLLTDLSVLLRHISEEVAEAARRLPAPRKTVIAQLGSQEDPRAFVVSESSLVSITGRGYLRKQAAADFRAQHRGGKGKRGARVKAEDVLRSVISCDSHDVIFAFTDRGRVAKLDALEIPAGEAGRHAANLGIGDGEHVMAALAAGWPLDEAGEVVLATNIGEVKRIPLASLVSKMTKILNLYKSGTEGEEVIGAAMLPGGSGEVFLASSSGLGTRFAPGDVRMSQRDSGGVRGIDLGEGSRLVSLGRISGEGEELIMCVASDGYGKRVNTDQFPIQNRGGKGRILMKLHEGASLVSAMVLREEDHVLVATAKGMTARFRAGEIRELGRAAMGSRVMDLAEGDTVVSAAVLPPGGEED